MDNFDKIFKEKIEQIQFEYDPNDWKGIVEKQKQNPHFSFTILTKSLFFAFVILGISILALFNFTKQDVLIADTTEKLKIKEETILPQQKNESQTNKHTETKILKTSNNNLASQNQILLNSNIQNQKTTVKNTTQSTLENNVTAEETITLDNNASQETHNSKNHVAETAISKTDNSFKDETSIEIQANVIKSKIESKKEDKTKSTDKANEGISELTVNGVAKQNEHIQTTANYIPEAAPVVIGEARSKSGYSFALLKKSLENYLSISQIGLERARDITLNLNNHFIHDPSISGFESRYTLSSIFNIAAPTEHIDNPLQGPYELIIANSFPIKSKQMGVGIAFQQSHGINYNKLLFNLSLAKQFVINRNNSILIGGGISTTSVDKLNSIGLDYPWNQNPILINNDNQSLSLNLGFRYLHKSLYASISASNVLQYYMTKDKHQSITPFVLNFASGGKLHLNEKWSINPSVNYRFTVYNTHSHFCPYISISKNNKIYWGLHSENLNSLGAHFGIQAMRRLDLFLRSGYSLEQELRKQYGPIHYGEIGLKMGIGEFKK